MTKRPKPAATNSRVSVPPPGLVTTPSVNTDDPATAKEWPKGPPAGHHKMKPKPITMNKSHRTNSRTMASGPVMAMSRSLAE